MGKEENGEMHYEKRFPDYFCHVLYQLFHLLIKIKLLQINAKLHVHIAFEWLLVEVKSICSVPMKFYLLQF